MRNLRDYEVERYRIKNPARLAWVNGWEGDETCGAFDVPSARGGNIMVVIATSGEMWDHVSVSLQKRCPTWYEMEQVARLFFLPNEVAMQLHVPARDHVNCHPNCLHWWRSHDQPIPLPPKWMVGPDENESWSEERNHGTPKGIEEPATNAGADAGTQGPERAASGYQEGSSSPGQRPGE